MAMLVRCGCGQQWALRPEDFGRDIPCPKCRAAMKIPGEPDDNIKVSCRRESRSTVAPRTLARACAVLGVFLLGVCVVGGLIRLHSEGAQNGAAVGDARDSNGAGGDSGHKKKPAPAPTPSREPPARPSAPPRKRAAQPAPTQDADRPPEPRKESADDSRESLDAKNDALEPHDADPPWPELGNLRRLRGHSREVRAVAFSSDNTRAASAAYDGSIYIWSVPSWEKVGELRGHRLPIASVAFVPGTRHLVSASFLPASREQVVVAITDLSRGQKRRAALDAEAAQKLIDDYSLRLWDVDSEKEIHNFDGYQYSVDSVAVSPKSDYVIAASRSTALVFELKTGREHSLFAEAERPTGTIAAACSPIANVCLLAQHGWLELWDIATGKKRRTLAGNCGNIRSICFSPDGQRCACATWYTTTDARAYLWDVSGRQLPDVGNTEMYWLAGVSILPDNRQIVAVSMSDRASNPIAPLFNEKEGDKFKRSSLRVFDIDTARELHSFVTANTKSLCLATSTDGRFALTGQADGELCVWGLPRPLPPVDKAPPSPYEIKRVPAHSEGISSLAISADGRKALVGLRAPQSTTNSGPFLWDLERGELLRTFHDPSKRGTFTVGMSLSDDGAHAGVCRGTNYIDTWGLESGKLITSTHAERARAMTFLADGKHFLVGISNTMGHVGIAGTSIGIGKTDGRVVIAKIEGMHPVRCFDACLDACLTIALSTDGKQMAATGESPRGFDSKLYYWANIGDLPAKHNSGSRSAAASKAASRNKRAMGARGFDSRRASNAPMDTNSPQSDSLAKIPADKTFDQHGVGLCARFSSDGAQLASGCSGGALFVWHLQGGRSRRLIGCRDGVRSVAFVRADTVLLSCESRGDMWREKGCTLRVWSLEDGKEIDSAHFEDATSPLAFSKDGNKAAYCALDGSIVVLDIERLVAAMAISDGSMEQTNETPLAGGPIVVGGLKKKVTLSFSQKALEEALLLLGQETGVRFDIKDKDRQEIGAKKRLSLDEKNQPAAQILQKMLKLVDPAGNVIYIVKGNGAFTVNGDGEGDVIVTTRAAAKEQGIPLSPELEAPPTARDEADEKATIDDLLPKVNDWTFASNVLKALWQPVDVKYDAASDSATVMLSVKQSYTAADASHFRGRHVQCVFYDSRAKALAVTNGSLPKEGNQGDEVKATIKLPNRDILEHTKRVVIRVDTVRLK